LSCIALSEPRSSLPLGVLACQLSIESESLNLLIILTASIGILFPGGHDTLFVLNDGRRAAQLLRLDKLARVKSLPLTFSVPWGLAPVPPPHFPLPAKIDIQVLEPIDLRTRFGDEPDWDRARDYVTSVMQVGLSQLASGTFVPMVW
jgi:hypothetical protein